MAKKGKAVVHRELNKPVSVEEVEFEIHPALDMADAFRKQGMEVA